jgi:Tfp pilus assembly protein PilF
MDPHVKSIYEGNFLQVLAWDPGSHSDEFWVTFSPFQTLEPFGLRLFKKRDCRALFIVPNTNEWYQHNEIWDALTACRRILDASSVRPIVYGSSMGGFAALAYSKELNARMVIAGSPQVSIDPDLVGSFDKRWSDIGGRIKFERSDCRDGMVRDSKVYVVYDSLHKEDRRHAEMLLLESNVIGIAFPASGHGVLSFLKNLGLVRPLIETLIQDENQKSIRDTQKVFRERKRARFEYFFALGERALAAKKYHSACIFLRKSIDINPSFHMSHSCLGKALWALGVHDEALKSFKAACSLAPAIGGHCIQLGLRLMELNRVDEAIQLFETAIDDFPSLSPAFAGLASALTRRAVSGLRKASDLYKSALEVNQHVPRWYIDAAYVEALLCNWQRVRLLLDAATELGCSPEEIAPIATMMPPVSLHNI